MASNKKRLGRGLGGLIAGGGGNASTDKAAKKKKPASKAAGKTANKKKPAPPAPADAEVRGYREVAVSSIVPNRFQPRREINDAFIDELAASIRSEGLLQPVVVRPATDGYELIAGERRWRAFKKLSLKTIPARIIKASDASSAAIALIENLQREGLNPVEEALGYSSLIRDFDLTQEAAAERVGKGRASVANALRLLTLEKDIQGYISKGLLSVGHAKVLLGLQDAGERRLLAKRIIEAGLSVRATELELKRLRSKQNRSRMSHENGDDKRENAAVQALEKRLMRAWNTTVTVKHSPKKGKIIVEYQGNDDLHRLLEKWRVPES